MSFTSEKICQSNIFAVKFGSQTILAVKTNFDVKSFLAVTKKFAIKFLFDRQKNIAVGKKTIKNHFWSKKHPGKIFEYRIF